jgi:DNA polymerase-3 subunit chi
VVPRVDFYLLPESLAAARFACSMTARARGQGLTVHIHAASRDEAIELDNLLWTFRDISFLPHCLADERDGPEAAPVVIGWEGQPPRTDGVLINLDARIPDFAAGFARIVEAVPAQGRSEARDRWRRYREMGCELHSHELDGDDSDG